MGRTEIIRVTMDFKSTIFIFGAALIFIPPLIISSPTTWKCANCAGRGTKDVQYVKMFKKHCNKHKYSSFSSIVEAKNSCAHDSRCKGVYDNGCDVSDNSNDIYLCLEGYEYENSKKSCVYDKKGICNRNFVDKDGDNCEKYKNKNWCSSTGILEKYAKGMSCNSYACHMQTARACPQCGCADFSSGYRYKAGRFCAGPTIKGELTLEKAMVECNKINGNTRYKNTPYYTRCGCIYSTDIDKYSIDPKDYTLTEGTKTHKQAHSYNTYEAWVK